MKCALGSVLLNETRLDETAKKRAALDGVYQWGPGLPLMKMGYTLCIRSPRRYECRDRERVKHDNHHHLRDDHIYRKYVLFILLNSSVRPCAASRRARLAAKWPQSAPAPAHLTGPAPPAPFTCRLARARSESHFTSQARDTRFANALLNLSRAFRSSPPCLRSSCSQCAPSKK